MNENDGNDEFGKELPAEVAKKRLHLLCTTHDEKVDYADYSDNLESDDPDRDLEYDADIKWLDEIIGRVSKKTSENYHENVYFTPGDKEMYVKMFSSIVLWSNVMNPMFKSAASVATSSDVESFFKSLKHGILPRKMLSAPEFLEAHINFVNAEIKLNATANVMGSKIPAKRKRTNSLDENSPVSHGILLFIHNFNTHLNNNIIICIYHTFTSLPSKSEEVQFIERKLHAGRRATE